MHERPFWNPFCVFCNKLFWVILQFFIQDTGIYLIAGVKNNNSSVIFRVSSVTFPNYCDYISHMQAVTQRDHYFCPILTKIRMWQHFVVQPQWNSFSNSQAVTWEDMLKLTYALRELLLWTHQQWINFCFWTYNYHLQWDTHLLQACLQLECRQSGHVEELSGCIVQPQYTVAALCVGDTEGNEGPSALSSLAQNMTTCFMNWISDFFPNTVNKDYKILHCATQFITLINNVQIVFQHRIWKFPFTTVTGHSTVMGTVG
jgi:hypothetical protein